MIPRAVMRALTGWFLMWSLLLALGGSAVGVLTVVERQRPSLVRAEELSYLPKGEYLKMAVLGYQQMAADLIWLKAVQHLGESHQTRAGYLSAYHAVDVLTDVDPTFVFAYLATGTVLGVWAELPRESIALLTKGMRHHPDVWQLPYYVGYDYFYELRDTVTAARYFRMASVLPGAPDYLPRLAARMTVEVGDPQAALEFLQRLYQQTEDERVRQGLARRMKEVIAERDIRFLEEGVRRYKARDGRPPVRLEDLVTGGIILRIPEEPFGGIYTLNVSDGSVTSTGLRERLRVYRK
jgi:tetratricopeptide (TPR) repeat protein